MKRTIIVIPTYNEINNIENLIKHIFRINKEFSILVIDDNSPDRTWEKVIQLKKIYSNLDLIKREKKLGLGSAYVEGFKKIVKEKKFDYIVQMDADFSHNPESINELLKGLEQGYDVCIGSRYVNGIRVINWPIQRLLLSYFANIYVRIITGLNLTDTTGGFKAFKREVLEKINLDKIKSDGYAFQIEMNYKCIKKNFKVKEVPIIFTDRRQGKSKLSKSVAIEAFFIVFKLRFSNE